MAHSNAPTQRLFIAEIFRSRQGEGRLTGTDSVFVRLSGCNLRCWFCDTPYTSWQPEGRPIAVEEVVQQVTELEARHIVITGGEPMIARQLGPLCQRLSALDRHITIETAGTCDQSVRCDLMSISPKLANSTPAAPRSARWHRLHEQRRHRPAVVARLYHRYPCQLKFVVDVDSDLEQVEQYLRELSGVRAEDIWLMPQGIAPEELDRRRQWLEPWCQQRGYNYCPRKHIEWYGNQRGT